MQCIADCLLHTADYQSDGNLCRYVLVIVLPRAPCYNTPAELFVSCDQRPASTGQNRLLRRSRRLYYGNHP
jgi:hypothetical protein